MTSWKWCGMRGRSLIWDNVPEFTRRAEENHEYFQDSRSSGRDSNMGPPEYEAGCYPLDFDVRNGCYYMYNEILTSVPKNVLKTLCQHSAVWGCLHCPSDPQVPRPLRGNRSEVLKKQRQRCAGGSVRAVMWPWVDARGMSCPLRFVVWVRALCTVSACNRD
jgi:hypothetical protein